MSQTPDSPKEVVEEKLRLAMAKKGLRDISAFIDEDNAREAEGKRFVRFLLVSVALFIGLVVVVFVMNSRSFAAYGSNGQGFFQGYKVTNIVRDGKNSHKTVDKSVSVIRARDNVLLHCKSCDRVNPEVNQPVDVIWVAEGNGLVCEVRAGPCK